MFMVEYENHGTKALATRSGYRGVSGLLILFVRADVVIQPRRRERVEELRRS